MQSLATYSFSADLDLADAAERYQFLKTSTERWLQDKGVSGDSLSEGSFRSLSGGGGGTFFRRETKSPSGDAFEIRLVENTDDGQIFSTEIYYIREEGRVTVFSKLSVIGGDGVVAPVRLDPPRCPKIIRCIISSFDDWKLGGNPIPSGVLVTKSGDEGGRALCALLRSHERNLPVVVVSYDRDEVVWEGMAESLAQNLIGLASVVGIDEGASWILSEEFGSGNSCYLGAVRVYWPLRGENQNTPTGPVWSAAKQDRFGTSRSDMAKFVSYIRGLIMSAAAQTLIAPSGLRNVHAAAMVARLTEMSRDVRERELNSIVEENFRIETDLANERKRNQELIWENERLQARLDALSDRKEAAENDVASEETDAIDAPKSGDVRYYKKIGTGGGVDNMVHTSGRNHPESAWKAAHRADQAVKGIHKLEKRQGWKSIFHCNICTGGGHWRVHW